MRVFRLSLLCSYSTTFNTRANPTSFSPDKGDRGYESSAVLLNLNNYFMLTAEWSAVLKYNLMVCSTLTREVHYYFIVLFCLFVTIWHLLRSVSSV